MALAPEAADRHLSPKELADRYDVPVQTVYRWRMKGEGPRGLRIGKHIRFRQSDIEAWEESRADPKGSA